MIKRAIQRSMILAVVCTIAIITVAPTSAAILSDVIFRIDAEGPTGIWRIGSAVGRTVTQSMQRDTTFADVTSLTGLGRLKKLSSLMLSETRVDDAGLAV